MTPEPLPERPLPYTAAPPRRRRARAIGAALVAMLVLTAAAGAGALALGLIEADGLKALVVEADAQVEDTVIDEFLGAGTQATDDPLAWFEEHRDELDEGAAWAEANCCLDPYYGDALPEPLAHLTDGGRVAQDGEALPGQEAYFFVQWFGIPDDAGGFWWSPNASPSGNDMFGLHCQDPVDLGEGWWMCGM